MSTSLILVRAAHHVDGIEVLERAGDARHYELVATFPVRRAAQARAYAAALAAAASAGVEDQLPRPEQPGAGPGGSVGSVVSQLLFVQRASVPTWLGRAISRQDGTPPRWSRRPPRPIVPGSALRA